MHHLVRRGLYCEIRPVFHRPDCRVLFTRIMGEVAVHFFVQFGNLRKSLVRYHTLQDVPACWLASMVLDRCCVVVLQVRTQGKAALSVRGSYCFRIVHHSSFISHHASSIIHHPSSIIHQSSFIIRHLSVIIRRSSFIIHQSSSIIHQSSSISHHSSVIILIHH